MSHYNYQEQLHLLWKKSVDLYKNGTRGADNFFTDDEMVFIRSIGATAQDFYDFAEDYNNYGEPDFTTFALVQDVRRNYFFTIQNKEPSKNELVTDDLPAKTDEIEGISWLPRIIPKAKAKIRGELNPDIMYGCGGDRRFLKTHDIHPAEFLRVVWANEENEQAVVEWVKARFAESGQSTKKAAA